MTGPHTQTRVRFPCSKERDSDSAHAQCTLPLTHGCGGVIVCFRNDGQICVYRFDLSACYHKIDWF